MNSKPCATEFVKFNRTLFSHQDRPSSDEHVRISGVVREYEELLRHAEIMCHFSTMMISDAIDYLESGKAAGFNGMSNEFFIAGNSELLV